MAARKTNPWSFSEVKTFLTLLADDRIQGELNGCVRNEKVYRQLSAQMRDHGFERTSQQCRDKLKKLKSDYRSIKDRNARSGANRKQWKWFEQMDAIYGHRPANQGRETGVESAVELFNAMVDDEDDVIAVLREMQASDVEDRAQRDRLAHQMLLRNAALRRDWEREAALYREQEAVLRREQMAIQADFNQAILRTLGQLVQVLERQRGPPPTAD